MGQNQREVLAGRSVQISTRVVSSCGLLRVVIRPVLRSPPPGLPVGLKNRDKCRGCSQKYRCGGRVKDGCERADLKVLSKKSLVNRTQAPCWSKAGSLVSSGARRASGRGRRHRRAAPPVAVDAGHVCAVPSVLSFPSRRCGARPGPHGRFFVPRCHRPDVAAVPWCSRWAPGHARLASERFPFCLRTLRRGESFRHRDATAFAGSLSRSSRHSRGIGAVCFVPSNTRLRAYCRGFCTCAYAPRGACVCAASPHADRLRGGGGFAGLGVTLLCQQTTPDSPFGVFIHPRFRF